MTDTDRKFDVRTIDRFTRDGVVDEKEHQKYLDSLPDVADKAAPMESSFVHGVLDEDVDEDDE